VPFVSLPDFLFRIGRTAASRYLQPVSLDLALPVAKNSGRIRFLSETTDVLVLRAISTISGGETDSLPN